MDSVMEYAPRTLRVYLSERPDIGRSNLRLTGPNGEVSLSRFHIMGSKDLMIEIDDYPLPDGQYTVDWTARFEGDDREYAGNFQFEVAAE